MSMRVVCLMAAMAMGAAGQWGQFRGPNGSGVGTGTGFPVEFAPGRNMAWKSAAPYGQSSPVLAGGRLYVTGSEGEELFTVCLDEKTGRELWRRSVRRERKMEMYKANDPASPTPAADEAGVYAFFPEFGLVAYTVEGKERWRVPLGPFKNFYGMSGSPVLSGEMVVLVCDQLTKSFALAVDRKSGKTKWRVERPGMTIGWATPMVFRPGTGPAQLIVLGSTRLDSYDLETGERRWWMPVASMGSLGVPVAMGETLLISTYGSAEPWMPTFDSTAEKLDKNKDGRLSAAEFREDKEMGDQFGWLDTNEDGQVTAEEWNTARSMGAGEYGAFAVKPGGKRGELGAAEVLWRFKKNLPYLPALLVHDGVLYLVKTGGIVTSLDAATGERLKEGRATGAPGEYYASPVAAEGKVYLASEAGRVSVLKAGRQWELLAVNDMGEEIHATPALSGGRVYVRTKSAVFCFAEAR